MAEGMGFHHMWGLSPAFDFQPLLKSLKLPAGDPSAPLNILLVAPGDIRHVLNTIAYRNRIKPMRPINFYIFDSPTEVLARHLLLLQVAFDWSIPIRHRCNTFLEVYGNSLLQERTMHYVAAQGKNLIRIVCDDDKTSTVGQMFDLSHLKFKTKDELEIIFKGYGTNVPFDAVSLHDHRQRGLLKERFDSKQAMYDWAYQGHIKKMGASIIHVRQYRRWRETGIAMEFGDQTYTNPNRSMASYQEGKHKNGSAKLVKGLWVDIVASPYISLGLDCDRSNKFAEGLFRILNKGTGTEQHRHHAVEVCCYNILSFLHEIETGKVYKMLKEHEIYSGLGGASKMGGEKAKKGGEKAEKDAAAATEDAAAAKVYRPPPPKKAPKEMFTQKQAVARARQIFKSTQGVRVILMGGTGHKMEDFMGKGRYKGIFDAVWLNNFHVHLVNKPHFSKMLKPNAAIVMECCRHVVAVDKENKRLYVEKIHQMGLGKGWKCSRTFTKRKPEYCRKGTPAMIDPELELEQLVFTTTTTSTTSKAEDPADADQLD